MPMEADAMMHAIADRLRSVPGLVAVVLGGGWLTIGGQAVDLVAAVRQVLSIGP
jgi:hypothetical protein